MICFQCPITYLTNKIDTLIHCNLLTFSSLDPKIVFQKAKMRKAGTWSVSSCMKDFSNKTSIASRGRIWTVPTHFVKSGLRNTNLLNQEVEYSTYFQASYCSYNHNDQKWVIYNWRVYHNTINTVSWIIDFNTFILSWENIMCYTKLTSPSSKEQ